jgi:hypothetical protein
MPVAPADIHGIGTKLWAGQLIVKTEEACVRTIAGRAYYAAYLVTRQALRNVYGIPEYDVTHGSLSHFMINSGQPTLKVNGNALKELFEARVIADYFPDQTLRFVDAEGWLENSGDIIAQAPAMEPEFDALPGKVPRKTPD